MNKRIETVQIQLLLLTRLHRDGVISDERWKKALNPEGTAMLTTELKKLWRQYRDYTPPPPPPEAHWAARKVKVWADAYAEGRVDPMTWVLTYPYGVDSEVIPEEHRLLVLAAVESANAR